MKLHKTAFTTMLENRHSFLRHVLTMVSGTVLAQAIAIAASPILTRFYSPEEMGILSSLIAITMIFGTISAGNYDSAIVLPDTERDATSTAIVGLFVAMVFGIVTTIVFMLFGDSLSSLFGVEHIPSIWLNIIGLMVFLTGLEQVLKRLCIRGRKFKVLSTNQISQQIGANAVKIVLGASNFGVGGLFLGTLTGNFIRSGRLLFLERKRFSKKEEWPTASEMLSIARKYKKFPLVSTWAVLLNSASSQIPVILFASLYSPTVAGLYALSHRILSLPMTLVGKSVGDVFMERAAVVRKNPEELSRITLGIYKRLLLIGAVTMSFMTYYSTYFFPIVFGDVWTDAGKYAQWISIWLIFQLAISPLSTIFSILEKQAEAFFWNLFLFIFRTGFIVVGVVYIKDPLVFIFFYSLVGVFIYSVFSIRVMIIVKARFSDIAMALVKNFILVYLIQFILYKIVVFAFHLI